MLWELLVREEWCFCSHVKWPNNSWVAFPLLCNHGPHFAMLTILLFPHNNNNKKRKREGNLVGLWQIKREKTPQHFVKMSAAFFTSIPFSLCIFWTRVYRHFTHHIHYYNTCGKHGKNSLGMASHPEQKIDPVCQLFLKIKNSCTLKRKQELHNINHKMDTNYHWCVLRAWSQGTVLK